MSDFDNVYNAAINKDQNAYDSAEYKNMGKEEEHNTFVSPVDKLASEGRLEEVKWLINQPHNACQAAVAIRRFAQEGMIAKAKNLLLDYPEYQGEMIAGLALAGEQQQVEELLKKYPTLTEYSYYPLLNQKENKKLVKSFSPGLMSEEANENAQVDEINQMVIEMGVQKGTFLIQNLAPVMVLENQEKLNQPVSIASLDEMQRVFIIMAYIDKRKLVELFEQVDSIISDPDCLQRAINEFARHGDTMEVLKLLNKVEEQRDEDEVKQSLDLAICGFLHKNHCSGINSLVEKYPEYAHLVKECHIRFKDESLSFEALMISMSPKVFQLIKTGEIERWENFEKAPRGQGQNEYTVSDSEDTGAPESTASQIKKEFELIEQKHFIKTQLGYTLRERSALQKHLGLENFIFNACSNIFDPSGNNGPFSNLPSEITAKIASEITDGDLSTNEIMNLFNKFKQQPTLNYQKRAIKELFDDLINQAKSDTNQRGLLVDSLTFYTKEIAPAKYSEQLSSRLSIFSKKYNSTDKQSDEAKPQKQENKATAGNKRFFEMLDKARKIAPEQQSQPENAKANTSQLNNN